MITFDHCISYPWSKWVLCWFSRTFVNNYLLSTTSCQPQVVNHKLSTTSWRPSPHQHTTKHPYTSPTEHDKEAPTMFLMNGYTYPWKCSMKLKLKSYQYDNYIRKYDCIHLTTLVTFDYFCYNSYMWHIIG